MLPYLFAFIAILLLIGLIYMHKYRELNKSRMAALERSERLAVEANRSKSAFLGHVSHELRTPLNAILGFTELMEEDLRDYRPETFSPSQLLTDLAKIKSSAYLQLAQVNNLLELTKLEAGKTELYLETFDVRTMVNAVLHHIDPMLQKTGNNLEVRFMPDKIGDMTTDFLKIQGILINLLANANKFTRKGLITLSILRAEDNDQIQFQVSDTGVGMSEEQLNMLFRGFTLDQAHHDHQMSGLGLHITQHHSQMMGGRITVESQLSKGSTFSVTLPAVVGNSQKPT